MWFVNTNLCLNTKESIFYSLIEISRIENRNENSILRNINEVFTDYIIQIFLLWCVSLYRCTDSKRWGVANIRNWEIRESIRDEQFFYWSGVWQIFCARILFWFLLQNFLAFSIYFSLGFLFCNIFFSSSFLVQNFLGFFLGILASPPPAPSSKVEWSFLQCLIQETDEIRLHWKSCDCPKWCVSSTNVALQAITCCLNVMSCTGFCTGEKVSVHYRASGVILNHNFTKEFFDHDTKDCEPCQALANDTKTGVSNGHFFCSQHLYQIDCTFHVWLNMVRNIKWK